jgi:hypothetical protein
VRTPSQTAAQAAEASQPSSTRLLDLLAEPKADKVSNREPARLTGFDHKFVAGFRAALAATGWGPSGY